MNKVFLLLYCMAPTVDYLISCVKLDMYLCSYSMHINHMYNINVVWDIDGMQIL